MIWEGLLRTYTIKNRRDYKISKKLWSSCSSSDRITDDFWYFSFLGMISEAWQEKKSFIIGIWHFYIILYALNLDCPLLFRLRLKRLKIWPSAGSNKPKGRMIVLFGGLRASMSFFQIHSFKSGRFNCWRGARAMFVCIESMAFYKCISLLSRWFEHATKGDNNKKHRRGRPEKKVNVVDFIFIRRCVCHTNASLVRNRYCCEWMNQVWSPLVRFSFTLQFQGNKNVEKMSQMMLLEVHHYQWQFWDKQIS